ncbi:MAG: ABC transporter substrate-binding protein/permease [Chitinivibrionales bacterium]
MRWAPHLVSLLLLSFSFLFQTVWAVTGDFSVALTGKYPPFSFYDENGNLSGFDVDVSRAIADDLNQPLKIVITEWDGILAGLLTGKFDAIIGSMAITEERAKKVDFSLPYYESGAQVFVHQDDMASIEGIEDLAGRKVGVVLGETYEHYLRKNHPEISIVAYKSTVDIFQDMKNDRLSGFLSDRLVGMYQIKSSSMPFVPAGDLLYSEQMGIPVQKDRPELLDAINASLSRLKSDGTLDQIHIKWFGSAKKDNAVATTTSAGSAGKSVSSASIQSGTVVSMLVKGFAITIGVAFLSLLLGFALAIPAGIILHAEPRGWYQAFRAIIDFIRGTPVLIQLFFVYFGAPQIGISLSPITSAIITLTVNSSAYMSEVIRSGLMAVDRGQTFATQALGLTRLQSFGYVIWPQAFRVAMPPLVNSAVALLKDTALISVISVSEIIREAQSIISVTYNPMKYYLIVAIMFFVLTYPLMKLAGRLEKVIKSKGFTA